MALNYRLKTKARFIKWSLEVYPTCALCDQNLEDEDHLFLQCPYSSQIWKGLLIKLGYVDGQRATWKQDIRYVLMLLKVNMSSTL